MLRFIRSYGKVEPHIRNLIYVEFFVQLCNAGFFLLINYYLESLGYADHEIAFLRSHRFLAVLLFAFPFGLYIKGRKLRTYFKIGAFFTPFFSLVILLSAQYGMEDLLRLSLALWGVSFTMLHATTLPYVMLNAKKETHTEAISMFFQTWIIATILMGSVNFLLQYIFPEQIDVRKVLLGAIAISFLGNFFVYRIPKAEQLSEIIPFNQVLREYDWKLIGKAVFPNFLIALGAGFTIPFINLFFLQVHGVTDMQYSAMAVVTFLCVSFAILLVPIVKRNWGYHVAISLTQSLAIAALILMATTEWYSDSGIAVYIAMACFIVRQPLMNVAGPMTSEVTLYFVGKKNQELMSSLNASIWSGSWFISAKVFQVLRASCMPYWQILMITAIFYVIGVAFYFLLIRDYYRRKELGEVE